MISAYSEGLSESWKEGLASEGGPASKREEPSSSTSLMLLSA